MKKLILPIIALTLMTTACNPKKDTLKPGIDVNNLDTSISPKVDFYQYACGGWMERNPLTGEYSRFGSFDKLAEDNREQLKGLIENIASQPAQQGTIEQKIGDLYNLAMNSEKLNADGYAPMSADLQKIASVKSKKDFSTLIPELLLCGTDSYFTLYVDADPMNSSQYLLQTYQSGISLGEREYYLDKDEHTANIREEYKKHVVKMFGLAGFTPAQAQKNMKAVMKIETRLATAAYDNVKLRNPYANYNKMTIDELQKLVPAIDWKMYLSTLGLGDVKEISVSQKESLVEVGNIIKTEPLENLIAYTQWKLIDGAAGYLSDDIYAQNFDFYGKILSGKEEQSPRWKRAVGAVNGVLGEAVGQMYVKRYFPPAAKERMLNLVHNLQIALGERISALDWMGDETKEKAHEKLNTFHVKIGYPDKWRDYSGLEIKNDSYYENVKRANRFEYAYMFAKAGKEVDKDEWLMTPQTVNAYYNPTTNEICFPAGILQYPFFDMEADDAFNYGAIGVVIGHEMTHGFDDQGRQFDKDGNLKEWWTADDAKRFEERAQVMVDFFDAIEVAPGVHANGKFTLGENIADYGGLQVSFQAFRNATKDAPLAAKDGFTPEQRFFLAYSTVWAGNIRPEEILVRTKSDPHSLGKWRVNGALPHIQAWYDAFDVKEGDPMFVPVEKRVHIW
ncbi:M13 family peptidase [Paludibacter sp. 221]|uniref:M13 family metallopeptidase n=1 Tax=Paludibacter sp. 221 TaxID=2302939 RepID=UPI0013D85B31|nr:M13 family metallopeptidase [Paludibacter sp. 221]NDV47278.1 M13 family peptidase [Paludibacter sp. 221]